MAVPEDVAWYAVQALFVATWAVIGIATAWLLLAFERTPKELLQLRLTREHERLQQAILSLAVGLLAGLLAVAPSLFSVGLVLPWVVAWTAAWCVGTCHGFLLLVRTFRVPVPGGARG
jgi:fatty acid desaturase